MDVKNLKPQQRQAYDYACAARYGEIVRITGYAGTGKTTVIGAIIDNLAKRKVESFFGSTPVNIFVGAPTHQSKKVLRSKITNKNVNVSTIHSGMAMKQVVQSNGKIVFRSAVQGRLFGEPQETCDVEKADIVIAEECSMISKEMGELLMSMWSKKKFLLILVGDNAQIPPVDDNESFFFSSIFKESFAFKDIVLTEVIRQEVRSPILDLATAIRENMHLDRAAMGQLILDNSNISSEAGFVRSISGKDFSKVILPYYMSESFKASHNYVKCIAFHRAKAERYSKFFRNFIIGDTNDIQVNDLIIFNEPYSTSVFPPTIIQNNDEAMIIDMKQDELLIFNEPFDVWACSVLDLYSKRLIKDVIIPCFGETEHLEELCIRMKKIIATTKDAEMRRSSWRRYYHELSQIAFVQYLYGITAHKSQGNTYEYTLVDVPDILSVRDTNIRNRILYTAITRASKGIFLKLT